MFWLITIVIIILIISNIWLLVLKEIFKLPLARKLYLNKFMKSSDLVKAKIFPLLNPFHQLYKWVWGMDWQAMSCKNYRWVFSVKEGIHKNLKTFIKLKLFLLISNNRFILLLGPYINFRRSYGILCNEWLWQPELPAEMY